jgi:hypothetical protein
MRFRKAPRTRYQKEYLEEQSGGLAMMEVSGDWTIIAFDALSSRRDWS